MRNVNSQEQSSQRSRAVEAVEVAPTACAAEKRSRRPDQVGPVASTARQRVRSSRSGVGQRGRSGGPGGSAHRLAPAGDTLVHTKKHLDRERKKQAVDTSGYAYPPQRLKRVEWRWGTADALEVEAKQAKHGKRKRSLLRKATAFRLCGSTVKVQECRCCKARVPGSGVQSSPGHPCNNRICATCQRRKSLSVTHELSDIWAAMPRVDGYAFRHGTLTTVYDPKNPDEMTAHAMRARAEGLISALRAAWQEGLKRKGTGLIGSVEIGDTGHVHIHFLYYGPFIVQAWLEEVCKKAFAGCGFSYIEKVEDEQKALREVAKYSVKAPSPLNERWFEHPQLVIHPTLAARWEVATHNLRVRESRGAFRKAPKAAESKAAETPETLTGKLTGNSQVLVAVPPPLSGAPVDARIAVVTPVPNAETPEVSVAEPVTASEPVEEEVACAKCRGREGFVIVETNLKSWLEFCHSQNQPAFGKSRIKPDATWTRPEPPEPLTRQPKPREVFKL